MNKVLRVGCAVLACIVVLVGVGVWKALPTYPYGRSHCCLKALGFALMQYADRYQGVYPAGAGSPEASLSLLYREDLGMGAETLRGKTVPVEIVRSILERGELLGPENCGWHYVEGLTAMDDTRLALVWDKIGLGHNGQDIRGGHSVWFVGPEERVIPASQWAEFLAEQKQLVAARTDAAKKGIPALIGKVRLPSGEIVDRYDASFTLNAGGSISSGPKLEASVITWPRPPVTNGKITLTLTLNGWTSKPVTVEAVTGGLSTDTIVFEMMEPEEEPMPGSEP